MLNEANSLDQADQGKGDADHDSIQEDMEDL